MLRAYPHVSRRYPDGDLGAMPPAELAELWTHLQAERDSEFRRLGLTVTKALLDTRV